jgi:hypothetical protein
MKNNIPLRGWAQWPKPHPYLPIMVLLLRCGIVVVVVIVDTWYPHHCHHWHIVVDAFSLTCGVVVMVVMVEWSMREVLLFTGGGGGGHWCVMLSGRWWRLVEAAENVDTLCINSPDQPCHRPITRQNRDRNFTGDFFLTHPYPRDSRTHDPARVCIPVSITTHGWTLSLIDISCAIVFEVHAENYHQNAYRRP